MSNLFDFIAANWRWLIAAAIALVYLLKGFVIVKQWERVPVTRLGRCVRTLGPGLSWVEPLTSRRLDARLVQDVVYSPTVPAVLTHDNVPVELTIAVTRYIAADQVPQTVLAVAEYRAAENQRALSTVAELVGRRPMDYIFDKRVEFCEEIRATLQDRRGLLHPPACLGEHFQGHVTVEPLVVGAIHDAHAASADFLHDAVVSQGLADHGAGTALGRTS